MLQRTIGIMSSLMISSALLVWSAVPTGAQGKSAADVYGDKCAVCHGADGAGKTAKGKKLKVQDVRETIKKFDVAQMTDIVTKGKGENMDGFAKDLTPAQISAVVEYYRGLAKK